MHEIKCEFFLYYILTKIVRSEKVSTNANTMSFLECRPPAICHLVYQTLTTLIILSFLVWSTFNVRMTSKSRYF